MTREEKNQIIEDLTGVLNNTSTLYVTDTAGLNADQTSNLRRMCYQRNIQLSVVKNTLLQKAMEKSDRNYDGLFSSLAGTTSIMLSDTGNLPAKLIKEFRKKGSIPAIKAAYVDEAIFLGDSQLENLVNLKSKNELLGDILALLQSPARNVISALQSSGGKIAGILKTLEERNA